MPSPIHDLITKQLKELLTDHRVVVWYDPNEDCASIFEDFKRLATEKVDARGSLLKARRDADAHWMVLSNPDAVLPYCTALVIYVPWARPATEEEQAKEPFEAYGRIGAMYGTTPVHSLESLARTAMPNRSAEIDRLYHENPVGRVTLEQLAALASPSGSPLVKQAFGSEDAIEVGACVIAEPERVLRALSAVGVKGELGLLLADAFGFHGPIDAKSISSSFACWALFSEFAFDVEGQVPARLASVGRAPAPYRGAIYRLCDRLRGADMWRDVYIEIAGRVAEHYELSVLPGEASPWGERDTFAAEDSAALRFVQAEALAGRLDKAKQTLDLRRRSIWLHETRRRQLWQLALRALDLLRACERFQARAVTAGRSLKEHILAYTSEEDGLWVVDRCQRWMEQAAGDCREREDLQPLYERAQAVYRQTIDAAQGAFFDAMTREGWPPPGLVQTEVFTRLVAPALQDGSRVAYFMLDAMRFEMGRDLAERLTPLGVVHVEPTATVIPTTTAFGMAALLPGAETSFGCAAQDGELVPTVGGKAIPDVAARRERFRELYGDRYVDLRLADLQDANDAKLKERAGKASLLVIRSDDIDKVGEGTNLPSARRFMSSILDDVATVAHRLARLGVNRMIFAADHGHVLLPEIPAGDAVKSPPGEWLLTKRRVRIGTAIGGSDGVRVLPAAHLGVRGPARDVALATGFRVFVDGASYFHEGASLEECLVPTVTLVVSRGALAPRVEGSTQVQILYKNAYFSQRVFIVKLKLTSLLVPELPVRVVVVEPSSGAHVGQVADCDARDPATGLVRLRTGVDEPVLLGIHEDYAGADVEIRVLDSRGAGVLLGSKRLNNKVLN